MVRSFGGLLQVVDLLFEVLEMLLFAFSESSLCSTILSFSFLVWVSMLVVVSLEDYSLLLAQQ